VEVGIVKRREGEISMCFEVKLRHFLEKKGEWESFVWGDGICQCLFE
jgi:hypothetical protein